MPSALFFLGVTVKPGCRDAGIPGQRSSDRITQFRYPDTRLPGNPTTRIPPDP